MVFEHFKVLGGVVLQPLGPLFGTKMQPRSAKKRDQKKDPKMNQQSAQKGTPKFTKNRLKSGLFGGAFLRPLLDPLGEPQGRPKRAQEGAKRAPRESKRGPKCVQERPRVIQERPERVQETQSSFSAVPLRVLMKGAGFFCFWLSVASLFRVPFLEPLFYSFRTNFGGHFRDLFELFSLLGVTWSKQRF